MSLKLRSVQSPVMLNECESCGHRAGEHRLHSLAGYEAAEDPESRVAWSPEPAEGPGEGPGEGGRKQNRSAVIVAHRLLCNTPGKSSGRCPVEFWQWEQFAW